MYIQIQINISSDYTILKSMQWGFRLNVSVKLNMIITDNALIIYSGAFRGNEMGVAEVTAMFTKVFLKDILYL